MTIFRKYCLIVVIFVLTNNNTFEIILKVNNDDFVVSNQEKKFKYTHFSKLISQYFFGFLEVPPTAGFKRIIEITISISE